MKIPKYLFICAISLFAGIGVANYLLMPLIIMPLVWVHGQTGISNWFDFATFLGVIFVILMAILGAWLERRRT